MNTTYLVSGMTCGHCELSVQEELAEIDGVTAVKADHVSGKVEVTSQAELSRDDVERAVTEAGYTLQA